MQRSGAKKLELCCVLCGESLADLETACAGVLQVKRAKLQEKKKENEEIPKIASLDSVNDGYSRPYEHWSSHRQQIGGYRPLTAMNPKEVVATKCGHMFHQGCLRQRVHSTLLEGKGNSAMFCPICKRPFAMNRLFPVVIPPTKGQRDRYVQLILTQEQIAEMVSQLKTLRAQIVEEEANLKQIKEKCQQYWTKIEQRKELLDSVNGPTDKEIAELTKVQVKRQEILHVVTQHNADLLKLLAEESNLVDKISAMEETQEIPNPKPGAVLEEKQDKKRMKTSKKKSKHRRGKKRQDKGPSKRESKHKLECNREKSQGKRELPDQSEVVSTNAFVNLAQGDHVGLECKKIDTCTKWRMESFRDLMETPGVLTVNASPLIGRGKRQNSKGKDNLQRAKLSRKP